MALVVSCSRRWVQLKRVSISGVFCSRLAASCSVACSSLVDKGLRVVSGASLPLSLSQIMYRQSCLSVSMSCFMSASRTSFVFRAWQRRLFISWRRHLNIMTPKEQVSSSGLSACCFRQSSATLNMVGMIEPGAGAVARTRKYPVSHSRR